MTNSLLTVIIPVFNTEQYLDRCLESVVNQTEHELDIIIINDGSTDDSERVINKYISKHKNINYIKLKDNIGVGNARNIGIENSKAKYITFIDSDDWVDIAFYKKMLHTIESHGTDICIAGIITEVDDTYNWKYRYKYPDNFLTDNIFCLHALTKQYNTDIAISPIVNNKIYNRQLILENNLFFDESRRAQDLFFSFMVFIYANQVSICNDIFYHYYQRNRSATHNFSRQYIDDYFYILSTLKKELDNRNIYHLYSKEYESYVNHHTIKLVYNMFNNIPSSTEQKKFVLYILKNAANLISAENLINYFDIEKIRNFWHI